VTAPEYEPDDELVESVARALFDTYGQHDTDRSRRIARAVLAAVEPMLLARAWDEGYVAGWRNGNDYLSALNVNPYEKEADRG